MIQVCALILGFTAVVFSLAFPADAQPVERIPRIGYLSTSSADADKSWVAAFREGLRELGHVEGKNIVIEQRHAAQRSERLPALVVELVGLNVDALVVYGAAAIHAAKTATSTIPIIFTVSADPVGAGLVTSLARPGGNITGLSDFHADLAAKRLELIKEVVPTVSRVAVLFNPATPAAVIQLERIRAAGGALGVAVVGVEVRGPGDIDAALAAISGRRSGAFLIAPDPSWFTGHAGRIAEFALRNRLPGVSTTRTWADAGGLISYGTNFHHLWRRAATYVDRILKGAKPADLPVEQPTTFELVINLKTAKTLGLTIPPWLLLGADELIE